MSTISDVHDVDIVVNPESSEAAHADIIGGLDDLLASSANLYNVVSSLRANIMSTRTFDIIDLPQLRIINLFLDVSAPELSELLERSRENMIF